MARYIQGTSATAEYEQIQPRGQHQVRKARKAQHREERSLINLPYVLILSVAGIAAVFICCSYLRLQSSITTSLNNIERYETQLANMKNENDALESRINTSMNLDDVYRVATKELGMVYAHKDQIITYDKTESEYVRQYGDIPE